jgi:hypothetical protein
MPEYMTLEQLKEYVRSRPDDEILQVTVEAGEDSYEWDSRKQA